MKNKNKIIKYDDFAKVVLKDKDGKITGKAIIDLEDIPKIKKHYWYLKEDGYAYSDTAGYMHYYIMGHIKF